MGQTWGDWLTILCIFYQQNGQNIIQRYGQWTERTAHFHNKGHWSKSEDHDWRGQLSISWVCHRNRVTKNHGMVVYWEMMFQLDEDINLISTAFLAYPNVRSSLLFQGKTDRKPWWYYLENHPFIRVFCRTQDQCPGPVQSSVPIHYLVSDLPWRNQPEFIHRWHWCDWCCSPGSQNPWFPYWASVFIGWSWGPLWLLFYLHLKWSHQCPITPLTKHGFINFIPLTILRLMYVYIYIHISRE